VQALGGLELGDYRKLPYETAAKQEMMMTNDHGHRYGHFSDRVSSTSQKAYFGVCTALEYFDIIVKKNYDEYYCEENHLDSRLAMNAAVTAYHLHEWVFDQYFGRDNEKLWLTNIDNEKINNEGYRSCFLGKYRNKIEEHGCQDFGLFHDLANGAKHFRLSRSRGGHKTSSVGTGEWGRIAFEDIGGTAFGHDYILVSFETSDGRERQRAFENCLRDFIAWWTKIMEGLRS
jgi:hypothetical protein